MSTAVRQFASFSEFYPYYLGEHRHPVCRGLHFAGTTLVIVLMLLAVATGVGTFALAAPLAGYGPAWAGHFFFERNRPATFRYPLYSLLADFVMYWQMLTRRLPA